MKPSATVKGHFTFKNTGGELWTPQKTFLATLAPEGGASPLAGPDWLTPSRAAAVDREVPPGETGTFTTNGCSCVWCFGIST